MYDVIIVGAGPAGASAAIFTAKAGKKTLVIDNDKGVTRRAWLENHYGAPEISGPDLVETGKKQESNSAQNSWKVRSPRLRETAKRSRLRPRPDVRSEACHRRYRHVNRGCGSERPEHEARHGTEN